VGRQLLKLRRDGVVPYSAITDGTRWITKPNTHTGLAQMLSDAAASYRRALWHDQKVDVHIFTEKDAISGVILPVTEQWDVPLGVLRGYASESFTHSVAEAIKQCGKRAVYIYQLGDHDPSGVDAWRAFRESVVGFLGERITPQLAEVLAQRHHITVEVGKPLGVEKMDHPDDDFVVASSEQVTYEFLGERGFRPADLRRVTFARLAVTPEQIEDLSLPTRPTKRTDTRTKNFTGGSVEVDAIPAPILRRLVERAITQHIDDESYRLTRIAEDSEREILQRIAVIS